MSLERNKELVRAFYEAINAGGDLAALDDICAANYMHRVPEGQSLEWLKAAVNRFRTGFPDIQFHLEEVLAEGDRVWARWTLIGTHLGPFRDIEPTGIQVEIKNNFNLFRVADGRLVEDIVAWSNGGDVLVAHLRAASARV